MLEKIKKSPRLTAIFGFAALATAIIDNPVQALAQQGVYYLRYYDHASQQIEAMERVDLQDLQAFDRNRAATFNDRTAIDTLQRFSPDATQDLDKNILGNMGNLPLFIRYFLSEFDVKTKTGELISTVDYELGKTEGRGFDGKIKDELAFAVSLQTSREMIFPLNNLQFGNKLVPTPLQKSPQKTNEVLLHEISHILDVQTGRRSEQVDFLLAVQSDLINLNWRTRRYALRIAKEAGLPEDPDYLLKMPEQELATKLAGIENPKTFRTYLSDGYMNVRTYFRSKNFGDGTQDTLKGSASEIYAALGSIYLYQLQNNARPHSEHKLAQEMPRSYALVSRQMQMLGRYYTAAPRPFMKPPPT